MSVFKFFLKCVLLLLIECFSLTNSYAADNTGNTSFMDLESSVRELKSLIDKNSTGIVSITVYDDTGALIRNGSGFFIDREGRIITNASIWRGAYSAEVLSVSNSYSEVALLYHNEELDFALIRVKAAQEVPLEMDLNYKPNLGERVMVIGKSADLADTVSEGLISSFRETEDGLTSLEIQTTESILPYRNSKDGPVFNTAGNVIGMISDKLISDDPLSEFDSERMHAVTLNPIKHILSDSSNIEYLHTAKSRIWSKWLVSSLKSRSLRGFVYLYNLGSMKMITVFIGFISVIYFIRQIYRKYRKL